MNEGSTGGKRINIDRERERGIASGVRFESKS